MSIDIKSLVILILLGSCIFLLTGFSVGSDGNGRYQLVNNHQKKLDEEHFFIIDTKTGVAKRFYAIGKNNVVVTYSYNDETNITVNNNFKKQ